MRVTQRRFALDEASRTSELWTVPVTARALSAEPTRVALPAQASGAIEIANACTGYLLNAGQSGFFRVHYDAANFNRLVANYGSLDTADQLGLVLDYWAFSRSGDAPITDYLRLTDVMPAEPDPVLIGDLAGNMGAIAAYVEDRPSREAVRAYARSMLQPHFARLGWDPRPDEATNLRLARAGLIGALGNLGDEAVIAEARRRAANPASLDPSVRNTVLGLIAAEATEADYEALVAQARAATDFVEQRRLWRRVAAARDEALARRTLAMTLTDDMPRQLRPQILGQVSQPHPRLAWDFLVANRAAIEAMLDPLQRLDYPSGIAGNSSDPAVADALLEYHRDLSAGALRSVEGTAANIRTRAGVRERNAPAVEAWVAQRTRAGGRGR